jgi:hypothetical protein
MLESPQRSNNKSFGAASMYLVQRFRINSLPLYSRQQVFGQNDFIPGHLGKTVETDAYRSSLILGNRQNLASIHVCHFAR